jgi:hypothetical protein
MDAATQKAVDDTTAALQGVCDAAGVTSPMVQLAAAQAQLATVTADDSAQKAKIAAAQAALAG